jgi:hypothetical protein
VTREGADSQSAGNPALTNFSPQQAVQFLEGLLHQLRDPSIQSLPPHHQHLPLSREDNLDSHHATENDNSASASRKVIKDLNLKRGFEPRSEKEFDDTLEEWETAAIAHGHTLFALKNAIITVSGPLLRETLSDINVAGSSYQEFKDNVARLHFKYSHQTRLRKK